MVSDFVKGKKKFEYVQGIQHGITLHRAIDAFTDEHFATRQAKEYFRPSYRLYSGAFVDVLYDHFLATDDTEFTKQPLYDFSVRVYDIIDQYLPVLPAPFRAMFPYMKGHNWLFNYRTIDGIKRSLAGVVRRAAYLSESETAAQLFEKHYQPLQECYRQFWKDLKPFAQRQFEIITNIDNTGLMSAAKE